MFEHDAEFSPKSTSELREIVESTSKSVVFRGRAIAALGRRAKDEPVIVEDLLRWTANPEFHRRRWVGFVTLAWIAALAVGYSQSDPNIRQRLRDVLSEWDQRELEDMRIWAKNETWLRGI